MRETHQLAEAAVQIETRKNESIYFHAQLLAQVKTHNVGTVVGTGIR
jgi:hypothetical protein